MPPILGQGLTDVKTRVGIEPTAAMCRRLAERGLFVGPSSGAYVHAALEIAAGGRFPTIATVISDIGECCASTGMRGGRASVTPSACALRSGHFPVRSMQAGRLQMRHWLLAQGDALGTRDITPADRLPLPAHRQGWRVRPV